MSANTISDGRDDNQRAPHQPSASSQARQCRSSNIFRFAEPLSASDHDPLDLIEAHIADASID
jgi:hypothetical protein